MGERKIYAFLGLIYLFTFIFIFEPPCVYSPFHIRTPVFQHRALLEYMIYIYIYIIYMCVCMYLRVCIYESLVRPGLLQHVEDKLTFEVAVWAPSQYKDHLSQLWGFVLSLIWGSLYCSFLQKINLAHKPTDARYRFHAWVKWVTIGLGNGLLTIRRQAITWTITILYTVEPTEINCSEVSK